MTGMRAKRIAVGTHPVGSNYFKNTFMLQHKYRRRILWYLCLPLLAGLALVSIRFPIAPALLTALGTYFPISLLLFIFNRITSKAYWSDRILGLPASRFMRVMIALGAVGTLLGSQLNAWRLVEISLLTILAAIDGSITEHELRPRNNANR